MRRARKRSPPMPIGVRWCNGVLLGRSVGTI